MTWRYIAQRVGTGEFLDWDIDIDVDALGWALSGAGSLSGTITPDTGKHRAADGRLTLEEWGTLIYAEADGQIRWGGIVIRSEFADDEWQLEAAGFATYPNGIPYLGEISSTNIDAIEPVYNIWQHLQSFPNGNLGVNIVGDRKTGVRLGKDAWVEQIPADGDQAARETVHDAEPYQLVWWESKDCGQEIDDLSKTAPFDYVERHYWGEGDEIIHEIELFYPRTGRRRSDLVFVQGVNVTDVLTIESNGDEYANEIAGIGSGEGRDTLRRTIAESDGRLRRVSVLSDKGISDPMRMDAFIREELEYRRATITISSVTVKDHANARMASWQLGDDVLVDAQLPWLGRVQLWCRITGWSLNKDGTATLDLARSDSFVYGS